MQRSAYIKIGALAVVEIALISALLLPVQTHAVRLDVPVNASHRAANTEWVPVVLDVLTTALVPVVLLAILSVPILFAIRIVRRERAAARISADFS